MALSVARLAASADVGSQTGNGRLNLARAIASTSNASIQPNGAGSLGNGGPFVGPYVAASIGVNTATTLNGSTSAVSVAPNASISVVMNVTTSGSGTANDWNMSAWKLGTTAPTNASDAALTCVNTPDVSGAGTYTASFTITAPAASGTYNLYLYAYNGSSCNTSNGPSSLFTRTGAVVVDTTPPTVTSITPDVTPTAATSATYTVTFSESVTGVATSNFSLVQAGGVSGASLTSVSGSGTTRTVTINTGSSNGTIRLDLSSATPAIPDLAGNALAATFSGGSLLTIEKNITTGNNGSGGTITIAKPANTVTGDFLLAAISSQLGGSISTPSGWILIHSDEDSGSGVRVASFYRIAGASDSSWGWAIGGSESGSGTIIRYAGIDTANPIDVQSSATGTSGNLVVPSITTTGSNRILVGVFGRYRDVTWTAPAGMIIRVDQNNASGTDGGPSLLVVDQTQTSAGASGARTATPSTTGNWAAQLIALRPAVVATTTTIARTVGSTPSVYGTPLTFTATVAGSGATPTGTVTFMDGATTLGTSTLASGSAPFSIANIFVGSHTITAVYGGDATHPGSTSASGVSQVITTRPITVTAATNTKTYDGTTSAAATPTITSGSLVSGDSASFTETYSIKIAATGKTLVPAGTVSDGNGGANYSVTFVNNTTGIITQRPLTYTLNAVNKVYDGTVNDLGSSLSDNRIAGDVFTQGGGFVFFANQHVGTGKTVTATGLSIGAGADSGNYTLTSTTAASSASITARPLTITAAASSKVYDGTTTVFSPAPNITAGALQGSDVAAFFETYNNKNAGASKTLTVSGVVSDGNGGLDYTYTFVSANLGTITARAITVTAVFALKNYDGTASTDPSNHPSAPLLVPGDTNTFIETFDNKNVGSGKVLTPSGVASDGNGGANYNVTFVSAAVGTIITTSIQVMAAPNSKGYDGTASAAAIPTLGLPGLLGNDTNGFTETYASASVGTGKTLIPSGIINDGNGGANYTYTFTSLPSGTITARALTITAASNSKTYDGTTSSSGCQPSLPASLRLVIPLLFRRPSTRATPVQPECSPPPSASRAAVLLITRSPS